MFQLIANIFGYILNFINNIVGNYGIAIIIFTVLIKLAMLPLSIKQQRTMKKSTKIQKELKSLQFKYKNDPEKLNKEVMDLYKRENMSPMSGCFSTIIQFILLISIFYMIRYPLTYMEKIDSECLNTYVQQLSDDGITVSQAYSEIDVIREIDYLKEKNPDDENLKKININMNFLGLDLSKIPQQNFDDWTVYIIPILYILSTFISMKITMNLQKNNKENKKDKDVIDITENNKIDKSDKSLILKDSKDDKDELEDAMAQSNKMMAWMMPLMSVSISLVAPLGLALYWLINNILMIGERLILNKTIKD